MKRKYISITLALTLLTLLIACGSPTTTLPGEPTPPRLPDGLIAGQWTAFEPGGDTVCADGSDYTYYVRPGTVNKLVVDFEGGGACWNGGTCGGPFYTSTSSSAPGTANSQEEVGLYDHTDERNPVKDWYHVYITYCTADIHLGDSVQTYETGEGPITINHKGQKNVAAVLDWVEDNFEAPEDIFMTGCSAGAYGAALYTPQIAAAYPDANVTELGDCGAGVIPEAFAVGEDGLNRWNIGAVLPDGVDLADGVPTTFLADAYVAIGKAYPDVTLAQYNSAFDNIQILFYGLQLGLDLTDPTAQEAALTGWAMGLGTSLEQIQTGLPGQFSSYTSLLDDNDNPLDGTTHCVITKPEFYTLTTSGVSFVEWLNRLLNDDAPPASVVTDAIPMPS